MSLPVVTFYSKISPDEISTSWDIEFKESGLNPMGPEDYLAKFRDSSKSSESQIFMFIGTGGTEELVEAFSRSLSSKTQVILLSHPKDNSLPASMEIRTFLSSNGFETHIIHKPRKDLMALLRTWTSFSEHIENIRRNRIGVLGKPSKWLIASNVDFQRVTARWGIEFIDYDLSLLERTYSESSSSDLSEIFQKKATQVQIPSQRVDEAARVASALLDIIRSENLDGVTVQCFDFLVRNEISGCLALCHANDQDGIIAGCEGDIPSTITMLIAKELTGTPSFMANVTTVDIEDNSAILAHCTVPMTIVQDYDLMTHFETDKSVGVRGRFKPQPVTVMKIFGEDLLDYWVSSGQITENLEDPDSCRTQVRIRFDEDVSYFLERSYANHHVVILGDYKELFEEFFSFMRLML